MIVVVREALRPRPGNRPLDLDVVACYPGDGGGSRPTSNVMASLRWLTK